MDRTLLSKWVWTLGLPLVLADWLTTGSLFAQSASVTDPLGWRLGHPLLAGWASADITPQKPVDLVGQYGKRIAWTARDPLTATALAFETHRSSAAFPRALGRR